jgi:hypothetical protein
MNITRIIKSYINEIKKMIYRMIKVRENEYEYRIKYETKCGYYIIE